MSNKDGILITNEGVYGLVNPPPAPSSKDAALPHQDISSAAVRWDTFVDLSNSGFSFTPANPTFMSLIDKIPYTLNDREVFYPIYQACQITFTQTQTFSKMRLWLKGRKGQLSNAWNSLKSELPGKNMIDNNSKSANWANNVITDTVSGRTDVGRCNRDGMCNNKGTAYTPTPPGVKPSDHDTGIAHGIDDTNHGPGLNFDVWDISGPTTAADPTNTGATFALYENISPNGWNLGWRLILTETAPDGTMKFLNNKGTWQSGITSEGITFYYNPKAYALAKGSTALDATSTTDFHVPPLSKQKSTGLKWVDYDQILNSDWAGLSVPCPDFYVIHSQNTGFMGDHLWYCENRCGYQYIAGGGPGGGPYYVEKWNDIPVTFKKDHSYLANIAMVNIQEKIDLSGNLWPFGGPGLANVNALTYLELIV